MKQELQPLVALLARQHCGVSVSANAVTYRGVVAIGAQSERRGGCRAGERLTGSSAPHQPLVHHGLPAPGEEMVPSKEPMVVPAILSKRRSQRKLPLAPANRPVPPVIVTISSM